MDSHGKKDINNQLKVLKERIEFLESEKQRDKFILDNVGVSIWEEDISEVHELFDNLKNQG